MSYHPAPLRMLLGGTGGTGGTAGLANLHGQNINEKDQPGGYAGLDADGFLSPEALPVLDQLTQLLARQAEMIEQQKQTNELLFRLMLQFAGMQQGVPSDGS